MQCIKVDKPASFLDPIPPSLLVHTDNDHVAYYINFLIKHWLYLCFISITVSDWFSDVDATFTVKNQIFDQINNRGIEWELREEWWERWGKGKLVTENMRCIKIQV